MMDWTDRHCRVFHRLLSPHARLYTEMVTTPALLHGDVARHLDFDPSEHPVALQLGGSEPDDLAACARLAERWGYDEVNLNCGCPSERVQRGAFGACLMAEPALVRDGVAAMRDAVSIPVTVKHRIGIDRIEDYGFVRDFVATVAEAGVSVFIVHARNAWLKGLSPKENREVPPLRHEWVERLKRDLPALTFVANGGIDSAAQVESFLGRVDGVMIGRAAYRDPWLLVALEGLVAGEGAPAAPERLEVIDRLVAYAADRIDHGTPLRAITRHLLGLCNGLPGARQWRRLLSDPVALAGNDPTLIRRAFECVGEAPRRVPPSAAELGDQGSPSLGAGDREQRLSGTDRM